MIGFDSRFLHLFFLKHRLLCHFRLEFMQYNIWALFAMYYTTLSNLKHLLTTCNNNLYLQSIGNLNKITCHLVSAGLANCSSFVNNMNVVNITHWKSKILPHLRLQWKRRGFKFCLWVSCICICHCCKSGVAPFRNRAVREVCVCVRCVTCEWVSEN